MKTFTTFFHTFENHMFTKDVGIIAYIMEKYYGYKSTIACTKTTGDMIDHEKYLENIDFKIFDNDKDLDDHLKNTDVLMFTGLYEVNCHLILRYKNLNPNGKVYMKLDANPTWMFAIYKSLNEPLKQVLDLCSIVSVESRKMQEILKICFQRDIKFIPNGYYDFTHSDIINYDEKENTILFAGRVGIPEKANHILLEAFKKVAHQIPNWNIEFAGPVEDSFLLYLSNYFKQIPELKSRIKLTGNHNKDELKETFKRAKIFCLTSPSEACAHVFSESIYNGCYLISTDVDGALDITDYCRYGQLYPAWDIDALARCLLETCSNENLLRENCYKAQKYAIENLTWIKICETLNNYLNECE